MDQKLLTILDGIGEYGRLCSALENGEGPMSVFGLGEAHRLHTSAGLYYKLANPMLIIMPSALAASRACEELMHYVPDALLFPARELPLAVKHFTESHAVKAQRMNCLIRLMSGKPGMIVTSIEAVMQRMAPPEALAAACHSVRPGMVVEPEALLKRFIDAGYTRDELCEGPGQVTLRGGYIDVYPLTAQNPVRIEFFDDEIDTVREFDPISQRSIQNLSSAEIPPATELPLSRDMRQKGIAALRSRPGFEEETEALRAGGCPDNALMLLPLFCREEKCLIDYLPQNTAIIMDEPSRIEESAKLVFSNFVEGLASVLKDGTAHPMQEGLVHSALNTVERLGTPRTAMLFSLTRSYNLIRPKELFRFETRPAPRYMGRGELLRDDLISWRKNGVSVLMAVGKHAERLRDSLADIGIDLPVKESLDRDVASGEQLILGEALPKGFEYRN